MNTDAEYFERLVAEGIRPTMQGLILSIFLYGSFCVLDWYMFPEIAKQLLPIRLFFIATAVAMIAVIKFYLVFYLKWSQWLLSLTTLVAGFGIVWMNYLLANVAHGDAYYAGIVLTIVFSTVYFPIRFRYVISISALLIFGYDLSLLQYADNVPVAVSNNFFLIASAIACAASCRNNERRNFAKYRDEALIFEQKTVIEAQQRRADELLRQILPDPIADRMLDGADNIADGYADVTVLFADLSGFTEHSSSVSPRALVKLLSRIFSGFDEVAEAVGAEKIKTIGDGYMAVCGLPNQVDDHPERMIRMAMGMCLEMNNVRAEFNGLNIGVRIGIHTGPCVAGVIGRKRFIFDLWGDAVNLASRMESTGIPGRVQVSEATYHRVKNVFRFDPKVELDIKGRGRMSAYILSTDQQTA